MAKLLSKPITPRCASFPDRKTTNPALWFCCPSEVANTLGIDRTTMVALLDGLEAKGIVARRPDPADRRRNVTELTANGRSTYLAAAAAHDKAVSAFLSPVSQSAAQSLRSTLHALVVR